MKSFVIIAVIISMIFPGCIEERPAGTPTPTATPTATETPPPTIVPTTYIPTPVSTPEIRIPVKYRVWIDTDYGFYRVRAIKGNTSMQLPSDFDILNFTINLGDRVRWINDDGYDFPLTVVSNEGLWTDREGYLRWQGERFEYTFNKTGTYTFSIKEYPRILNQTIVVNP